MKHRNLSRLIIVALLVGMALPAMASKPRLMIYNWADYIAPKLIKEFEKKYNCTVRVETFDSNEALGPRWRAGRRTTISWCQALTSRNASTSKG